jgi:hypothetical protein
LKNTHSQPDKKLLDLIAANSRIIAAKKLSDAAQVDKRHKVFMLREKEALSNITEIDRQGILKRLNPQNVLLLYGQGHDFSKELINFNQSNSPSEIDRGLIKITPKE